MADKHAFLSPEWFAAVKKIQEEHAEEGRAAMAGQKISMNQVVTNIPPGDDTRTFHMKIEDGAIDWGEGEAEGVDLTLTLDFETAKAVLVGGDPQVGMQAFMQGKIKIAGDMTKLMAMQGAGGPGGGGAASAAIKEITE
jgi:putative sterol carrier protein